jgi:hypothetical protein
LSGHPVHDVEHHLYLSANEVGQGRARTAIRHVDHVDASHHLEQLAGHMAPGSVAGRRHVDLARIGFGVGDELGDRLDRHRGIHLHDIGVARKAGDWCDVADEIETQFVVERRIDRVR